MYSLRYLSISHKLWLLTLFTAIGLIIASLLQLNEYRSGMMKEKETQIRVLIETAYSIASDLHTQVEKGSLDREQAQQRAAAQIKALRYDKTNYFWINTFDARIVMHPIKPELNGKDLSNFSDPAGKKIFSEFAALAKRDGEGVVPYLWEKPGKNKPVNKISFVKSFTPWGWVIGTGIYVDDVDEAYWKSALTQGVTALVILGIMLALSIVITRSIVAPLKQTISALDDISLGEGDLTRRLDEAGRDEIMKLSVAFNRFSEKIRLIIIQVSQGSNQLATAAEELSSSSLQTHDNISLQQNETQQVATAVTEMAATVKEIAESAEGAANSARSANEQAVKGKQVVVDVTEAITNLASEMNSTSEVINVLAKESESIGSVSDVIRGIAEQTSLLALNAAIEAARAGEQGRGFAVVADEVRSLASRTQQATTEIRDMIERLQSGTQNAVDVIHRSEQTTTATVQKADAAAESLDQIVSSVALISDRNIQIASAAEEQSAVAQEIDRSIVEISQLADHSALASEQITQATGELSQLSVSLRDIISNFKTG